MVLQSSVRLGEVRKHKMDRRRVMAIGVAAFVVPGCSGNWGVKYSDVPEPNKAKNWYVVGVRVTVPDSLTVSEANTYAPSADIVWHGEEQGDRRAQVRAIIKEGLSRGSRKLDGRKGVILAARVIQFHAVTPIAVNQAPGAVHNIKYDLQVYNARTLKPLTDPQRVSADLQANVGTSAVIAAINGNTQRVRIVRHLTAVTEGWLGLGPDQRGTFEGIGR